jgi:glycogen operon protein
VTHEPAVFGHAIAADGSSTDVPNEDDSAPFVPRSIVIDSQTDWENDAPPRRPLRETVIYELHVKAFTAKFPDLPPEIRGT